MLLAYTYTILRDPETYMFLKSRTSFKNTNKNTLIQWISNPDKADHETQKMLRYVSDGMRLLARHDALMKSGHVSYHVDRRITFLSLLVSTAPLPAFWVRLWACLPHLKDFLPVPGEKRLISWQGISEALITTQTGLIIAFQLCQINRIVSQRINEIFHHPRKPDYAKLKGILETDEEED